MMTFVLLVLVLFLLICIHGAAIPFLFAGSWKNLIMMLAALTLPIVATVHNIPGAPIGGLTLGAGMILFFFGAFAAAEWVFRQEDDWEAIRQHVREKLDEGGGVSVDVRFAGREFACKLPSMGSGKHRSRGGMDDDDYDDDGWDDDGWDDD
jgi:1,4-dihydroxy-2-naphthoate octaprenyltransferase